MALNLSKTGIVDGQIITAAQITQSIDALTAAAAYNITISGSFSLTGNTTGSGYFANANVANSVRPQNVASSASYTIPYLASTGSTSALYYAATGPTYNPVTETVKATNFEGTASFATTASHALNAGTPSSVNSYVVVNGVSSPFPLGFIAGSDILNTVTPGGFVSIVNIPILVGRILGSTAFITATISGSAGASASIQVNSLNPSTGDVVFQSSASDTFYYHILYR